MIVYRNIKLLKVDIDGNILILNISKKRKLKNVWDHDKNSVQKY